MQFICLGSIAVERHGRERLLQRRSLLPHLSERSGKRLRRRLLQRPFHTKLNRRVVLVDFVFLLCVEQYAPHR